MWVSSECFGFLTHSKDMQVSLIGIPKLPVGVKVSNEHEWLFVSICQPCDAMAMFQAAADLATSARIGLSPLATLTRISSCRYEMDGNVSHCGFNYPVICVKAKQMML